MKKRLVFTGIVFVIIVAVIGGYAVFNGIFPKAKTIEYPTIEDIVSISVSCNEDDVLAISNGDFEELLLHISIAEPTRKPSLNDYPTARPYYTIDVGTATREYRYFIYEEDSRVYIEMPYEGIYKSGEQLLCWVLKYFEE